MSSVSQKKLFSSLGQAHEFELALLKEGVTGVNVQDLIDGKLNISFAPKVRPKAKKKKFNPSQVVAEWQNFYKKHFGMDCDFLQIRIPKKPEGGWLLLVMVDVSLEQLYARCKELFHGKVWRWTEEDLDKKVSWNERDAKNGPYAIWVKDVQEADENLKNVSANRIKEGGIKTETVAERMIHEIKFSEESGGKHLDENSVTLCAGSRYDDGCVPSVRWRGDEMSLGWCRPGSADGSLRAREVVS